MDTWGAMETLVDGGKCKAIGLSDVSLEQVQEVFQSARIKPAVLQVESHPYLPQTEMLEFSNSNGLVMLAFAPLARISTNRNSPNNRPSSPLSTRRSAGVGRSTRGRACFF